MTDSLEVLAGMQDQVARARRLAVETRDAAAAARLRQIAADLEQYVRQALALHSSDNDNAIAGRSLTLDS
jgi:hypothetical protein